jgi:hypothetical protein
VFGAPTFSVRGELFWGGDRLGLMESRLRRSDASDTGAAQPSTTT